MPIKFLTETMHHLQSNYLCIYQFACYTNNFNIITFYSFHGFLVFEIWGFHQAQLKIIITSTYSLALELPCKYLIYVHSLCNALWLYCSGLTLLLLSDNLSRIKIRICSTTLSQLQPTYNYDSLNFMYARTFSIVPSNKVTMSVSPPFCSLIIYP